MNSGITRDDWLKALAEVGHADEDDQSAMTVKEMADMLGVPEFTAARRLDRLAAAGKATRTRKWSTGKDGRTLHRVAYRLT